MAHNGTGRVGYVFAIVDRGVRSVTGLFDYHAVDRRYISVPPCSLPGCQLPRYVENDGLVHDFCGKKHASMYKAMKEEEERQKRSKKQHNGGGRGSGFDTSPKQQRFNYSGVVGGQSQTHHAYGHGMNMQKRSGHGVIRFYNKFDDYYQFTNFYPAPILLDGKKWPTTEHYFQAQKFIGTPFVEVIRKSDSPRQAFDLSRNPAVSRWRRKDWEEVKIDIMRNALLAKFTQHEDLRQVLLSTEGDYLIEHTPHDKFWGNGGDDSGRNQLGLLLMDLRSELQLMYNILSQNMGVSGPVITKQPVSTVGHGRGNILGRSRVGTDQGSQFAEEGEGSRSASPHRELHQDVGTGSGGKSESPATTITASMEDTEGSQPTRFVDDLIDFQESNPEKSIERDSCIPSAAPAVSCAGTLDLLTPAGGPESITGLPEIPVLPYTVTSAMRNTSASEAEVLTTAEESKSESNTGEPAQTGIATNDIDKNPTDVTSPSVKTESGPSTPTVNTPEDSEFKNGAVDDAMEVITDHQNDNDEPSNAMETENPKQDDEDIQMEE